MCISPQKKRKARALWIHILIIPYISRKFAIERCRVTVHPPSQHRSTDRYFLTQKRRLQQRRAKFRTLHQTARAMRAVRRITRRLSATLLSIPMEIRIHWWYYRCTVIFQRAALRMKRADWIKADTAVTILYKIIKTQINQPRLYSYVSSITCSAGIPLTRN